MSFCRPARPPRVTPLPSFPILLLDKTPGRWTDSPFESFPPPSLITLFPCPPSFSFLLRALLGLLLARAAPFLILRRPFTPLRYTSSPYTPTLFLYLAPLCTTPRLLPFLLHPPSSFSSNPFSRAPRVSSAYTMCLCFGLSLLRLPFLTWLIVFPSCRPKIPLKTIDSPLEETPLREKVGFRSISEKTKDAKMIKGIDVRVQRMKGLFARR